MNFLTPLILIHLKHAIPVLSFCLMLFVSALVFQGCQQAQEITGNKSNETPETSVFSGVPQNIALDRALKEVEDYPELHETHFDLAAIYSYLGQRKKAIAEFREAIKIEPDNLNTLAALATEHCLSGHKKEAWDYYKTLEKQHFEKLDVAKNILNKHCP